MDRLKIWPGNVFVECLHYLHEVFSATVRAMCSLFFMDPLPKGQCSECIEERAGGILTEWVVGLETLKD